MTIQSSTPHDPDWPQDEDWGCYAQWDETGTRLLCNRLLADGTRCDALLALLHEGWAYGRHYALLRFPHRAWVEINGVWRTTTSAKLRVAKGLAPRTQDGIGPQRITERGSEGVGGYVPVLPTFFRCPRPRARCGHKRLVDPDMLGVDGAEEHGAWLLAQMNQPHD